MTPIAIMIGRANKKGLIGTAEKIKKQKEKIVMEITNKNLLTIINELMKKNDGHYFREAQLQFDLAWALRESFKDDNIKIHLEYFAKNKIKDNNMYYDIVIENGEDFIPIELKFKTKKINGFNYSNQAAQDLGRYDFWKDVERIENFKDNTHNKMSKGYAVFITNDDAYKNNSGEKCIYKDFAINDGREIKKNQNLAWTDGIESTTVGTNRMYNIKIAGEYVIKWEDVYDITDKYKFRALILEIS